MGLDLIRSSENMNASNDLIALLHFQWLSTEERVATIGETLDN